MNGLGSNAVLFLDLPSVMGISNYMEEEVILENGCLSSFPNVYFCTANKKSNSNMSKQMA